MGGLMRAYKCATWRACRCVGMTLVMAVGFIFYFMILQGTNFTLVNIVGRFPQSVLMVGSLMYLFYGMVDIVTYVQYGMSCGCTRRHTFFSIVYMHVFELAVTELVLVLYYLAVPADWPLLLQSDVCLPVLYLFVFDMGLSMTMGILVRRFGKIAYVLIVMFGTFVGGVIGGLAGIFGNEIVSEMIPCAPVYVTAAVLVWYVVMAVIVWLFIRKMEVRV